MIAHQVPAGVVHTLPWDAIPRAVAMIEDPNTTGAMRIKLVDFWRTCAKADLALNQPDLAQAVRQAKRAKPGSLKHRRRGENPVGEAGGSAGAGRLWGPLAATA